MNGKYKKIVEELQIDLKIGEKILWEMGIDKPNVNPSNDKLEGFRSVCEAIKNGVNLEEAASRVKQEREALAETESENKAKSKTNTDIEKVGRDIGIKTGEQIVSIIPPIQQEVCSKVVNAIEAGATQVLKEAYENMDFKANFDDFSSIDIGDVRQGKLKSGSDSVALPPSNSESSPEQ